MAQKTGTHDIASLLANQQIAGLYVSQANQDMLIEAFRNDLAVHNRLKEIVLADLAEVTTDRFRPMGMSDNVEMIEADEYSRAPTQKPTTAGNLGFPLRRKQIALGWTQDWLNMNTVADMAKAVLAAEKADVKATVAALKRAFYLSGNYNSLDIFVPQQLTLPVKRFWNADGMGIPEGPNGLIFDGTTHTHYSAVNGLTQGTLLALISNVIEHREGAAVRLVFNIADEATIRALAGFQPYVDPRLTLALTAAVPTERLVITQLDNRAIGIFGASEVWLKPWAIAGYAFAYDTNAPKVLAYRQPERGQAGLHIAAENIAFPLYARYMQDSFGFGVANRSGGAILDFSHVSYTDPVISG